jgi:hypothetical protein
MAKKGTQVTRRGLLQIGSRSLFAVALTTLCRPFAFAHSAAVRLQDVTADTFLPYLGRVIEFRTPVTPLASSSGKVALVLARIDRHGHLSLAESRNPATRGKRTREPFSLLFESRGTQLSEGLHTIAHRDFASCELLLSPVGRPKADGTIYYEAVFG